MSLGPSPRRNLSVALLSVLAVACAEPPPPTTAIGVTAGPRVQGDAPSSDEPTFAARAIGPLTNPTRLQIVSVFSYEPGETLLSPATEIASFVSDARTGHGFGEKPLQSMVVTPTPSTIKADRLLVIAWGRRSEFSLARAKEMGHAAMRAAIEQDVAEMAYAPIARDQGVTTIPADEVAAAFVEGALVEFMLEQKTEPRKAIHLEHVTYEAGAAFVDAVSRAVARGVASGEASLEKHGK
jgi:hypothetical protein